LAVNLDLAKNGLFADASSQEKPGKSLEVFPARTSPSMERGHCFMSKATAKNLAELFHVSVEKFL